MRVNLGKLWKYQNIEGFGRLKYRVERDFGTLILCVYRDIGVDTLLQGTLFQGHIVPRDTVPTATMFQGDYIGLCSYYFFFVSIEIT